MTVIELPVPRTPEPAPAPTPASAPAPRDAARLVGLDIARGLAVLGMAAAHVAMTSDDLTTLAGWLQLTHGRSSILFALLAGVSFGIMTGARTPYTGIRALQARTRILVRSAMLLAVAGLLALLSTPIALILAYYAVWFVLALPFARWPFRRLLVAGLGVGILGSVAALYLEDLASRLSWSVEGDANSMVVQTLFGTYPGLMWMGFVLVGMALSRLDLSDRGTLLRILGAGVVAAIIGHGISMGYAAATSEGEGTSVDWSGSPSYESSMMAEDGMLETLGDGTVIDWGVMTVTLPDGQVLVGKDFDTFMSKSYDTGMVAEGPSFDTSRPLPDPDALLSLTPHGSTPTEFLGFGGTAAAIVALCLLLPTWLRRLALPLAAVGAMSLTAYSAHVLLIYGWPSFFMDPSYPHGNWPYAVMVGGLMVFALIWRYAVGRGPLEALLRSVSLRAATIEEPSGGASRT